jgi:hypothetical protein
LRIALKPTRVITTVEVRGVLDVGGTPIDYMEAGFFGILAAETNEQIKNNRQQFVFMTLFS